MLRNLSITVLILCTVIYFQHRRLQRLVLECERLELNQECLTSEITRLKRDSTLSAIDVKSLQLSVKEYKRLRSKDAKEIKRLGIKVKNLTMASKHQLGVNVHIETPLKDTIILKDSLPIIRKRIDFINQHITFKGLLSDNQLRADIHVPVHLRQVVWVEYKRRWLFWKRVKAIHQTISSDNPYVDIIYSECIKIHR